MMKSATLIWRRCWRHLKPVCIDIIEPFAWLLPHWFVNMISTNYNNAMNLTNAFRTRKRRRHRHTLVLDLDETLIHTRTQFVPGYDLCMDIIHRNRRMQTFYIFKRPYLHEFLEHVSAIFNVVVFTASHHEYADPVIDLIDERRVVGRRLFREACIVNDTGGFIKDLTVVTDDLRRVVLVDNNAEAFAKNPMNALPIPPWCFQSACDDALWALLPVLRALRFMHDLRNFLYLRTQSRHDVRELFKKQRALGNNNTTSNGTTTTAT